MAVQVYKDGEMILVKPNVLQRHLEAGYTLEPGEAKDSVEGVTFEDVDTNNTGKLSTDEVRQAAKEAGIEGWDKKRIKTLKAELGL